MALVDVQVRKAIRETFEGLLESWDDQPINFEHAEGVCYWTTRVAVPDQVTGEELHVVVAFLVADVEQEAKDWYRAFNEALPNQ